MKKLILFSALVFFSLQNYAQASIPAPSGSSVIATKADSLMTVAAAKLGVDTNASAAEIGEEIDTAISFVPGKHAGYLAWLKFLMKLFIPLVAIYFFIKHQLTLAKLKSLSKVALLLVASSTLFYGSANAQTIKVEKKIKYYQRASVIKQLSKKPTLKAQGSSKALITSLTTVAPIPTSGYIVSLEPSFGVGGLAIEKGLNGWETTGSVTPSLTYGVSVGEYTTNPDGSLLVKNYVSAGAFLSAGIIPQSVISGSFQTGGYLTIYNYATVGAGYDVATRKPFLAIGASVPFFTFKQGLGSTILKLF